MKTQKTFSCNIRVRHLVNDLSIFVSCAVPHNKTLFFFFYLLCLPNSFHQKLYRYNFSRQISLSYKNRLFFFHKIIHIINFSVIYSSVKVKSKAFFFFFQSKCYREKEQRDVKPSTIFFISDFSRDRSPRSLDSIFCIFWSSPDSQPLQGTPHQIAHNSLRLRFFFFTPARPPPEKPQKLYKLHQPTNYDKGNNGLSKTSHRPLLHFCTN